VALLLARFLGLVSALFPISDCRLWGDHGQEALGNARVCLLTAGPLGSETLKNLVLPGVGAFTIVDDAKVVEADLGNNFFVTEESVGQSRAKVVCELLQEMNADVKGEWRDDIARTILTEDPSFFTGFTAVIATDLDEATLLPLGALLWENKIPLLVRAFMSRLPCSIVVYRLWWEKPTFVAVARHFTPSLISLVFPNASLKYSCRHSSLASFFLFLSLSRCTTRWHTPTACLVRSDW
jgi:hypothetical protein